MAKPTSRNEHKEYCLRKLGKGANKINVTDDQIEDRIDESVQKFIDWHYDSTVREYWIYQLTASDITNQYITVPEEIQFVSKMYNFTKNNANNMFSYEFQITRDTALALSDSTGGYASMSYYVMQQQHLKTIDKILKGSISLDYNRHMDRIFIHTDWSKEFKEDDYLMFEVYRNVDGDEFPDFWNDPWLLSYTTSLIKLQWGTNLSKFRGVKLPGDIDLNGLELTQEAKQEIEKLEEDLINIYSEPVPFFVG